MNIFKKIFGKKEIVPEKKLDINEYEEDLNALNMEYIKAHKEYFI